MSVVRADRIGGQLLTLLGGPKRCTNFSIHFPVGGLVSVRCEYFPEITPDSAEKIKALFRDYELVARDMPPPDRSLNSQPSTLNSSAP